MSDEEDDLSFGTSEESRERSRSPSVPRHRYVPWRHDTVLWHTMACQCLVVVLLSRGGSLLPGGGACVTTKHQGHQSLLLQ